MRCQSAKSWGKFWRFRRPENRKTDLQPKANISSETLRLRSGWSCLNIVRTDQSGRLPVDDWPAIPLNEVCLHFIDDTGSQSGSRIITTARCRSLPRLLAREFIRTTPGKQGQAANAIGCHVISSHQLWWTWSLLFFQLELQFTFSERGSFWSAKQSLC